MKRNTGINCIELGTDANYILPPGDSNPNEANKDTEVKVYKMNPDGSKGELLRIEPSFPEGWNKSNPAAILPQKKKKEDDIMPPVREDKDVILQKAKDLIAKGETVSAAARQLKVPLGTLHGWLRKDADAEPAPVETPAVPVATWDAADEEPIPYQLAEALSEHQRVADEVVQLLDSKHRDYGTDNIRKFGSYGVLVRVSDKVERLINLSDRGTEPLFETTEDTWRDIAGYAILALIELREGR